ncbi:MAG: hypothetical protein H6942_15900 [Candidatus Accumulibacter sp.]|uniref:hypothetical protein n=1 Tax=Accumulibacter sp. TaxID=2053492 RepID=UPI0019E369F0|nr:hypothetical protein [Accumulibacter sp.]MBE2260598.1 hypothetical protein [Paracoccaceae bacterium]MCB1942561.1 hypothetical protein [Accumulibacter sp.]MCP5249992.1 hypothetical protein [Accumulibacter sp.]
MVIRRTSPTWTDLKATLKDFDRKDLLGLIEDLYAASKENKTFLHARFGLGSDTLKPYKAIIDRWLWPDVFKNQNYSVARARKPIADYRKAVGDADGLADLMVFYCRHAVGFSNEVGVDDEGYFDALIGMFEEALQMVMTLPENKRERFLDELREVRAAGRDMGGGVGEGLDEAWRRADLKLDA